jgi:hypothetical protein
MDTVFPFGFPGATAWYLVLYIATLAVHVVFMNYVLGGTAYLAAVTVFTGEPTRSRQRTPMALLLRDWMPFFLSAAITAGVAPLLFVQILYKKSFYTGNLLLFHRWMSVVPALIVGFYLLYLMKSRRMSAWRIPARVIVGVGAFVCFAFTGYSWTENHMLGLDAGAWPAFYGEGELFYRNWRMVPRFGIWFFGSFPMMCAIVAWQLRLRADCGGVQYRTELRRCAMLALGGLTLAAFCALMYYRGLDHATRETVTGRFGRAYVAIAALGAAFQIGAWLSIMRDPPQVHVHLLVATIAGIVTILGATVVREAVRLAAVDVSLLFEAHAAASRVGGLAVFLFFAAVNAGVIVWCVLLVRRNLQSADVEREKGPGGE